MPSREMVIRLADALQIPLREQNHLMMSAGFAPAHPSRALSTPELDRVRLAIQFMLDQQEPYPAFVLNRYWNILATNAAAIRVNASIMGGRTSPHTNMLRQFFDPKDLRAAVVNWQEIAGDLIRHLRDEVALAPSDSKASQLLDEVLAFPEVPADWRHCDVGANSTPLLTVVFRHGKGELKFFSTITTFVTPRDITLDELRIECAFPGDERTAQFCRQLRSQGGAEAASSNAKRDGTKHES